MQASRPIIPRFAPSNFRLLWTHGRLIHEPQKTNRSEPAVPLCFRVDSQQEMSLTQLLQISEKPHEPGKDAFNIGRPRRIHEAKERCNESSRIQLPQQERLICDIFEVRNPIVIILLLLERRNGGPSVPSTDLDFTSIKAGTAESRRKAAFAKKERRVDVHGFQGDKKSLRESKLVHGF
jgi:hypothetical protein